MESKLSLIFLREDEALMRAKEARGSESPSKPKSGREGELRLLQGKRSGLNLGPCPSNHEEQEDADVASAASDESDGSPIQQSSNPRLASLDGSQALLGNQANLR